MARTQKPGMTTFELVIPDEVRIALDELAVQRTPDQQGHKVYPSDVARLAIQEHLRANGYPNIVVDVDRGGYRERKAEE